MTPFCMRHPIYEGIHYLPSTLNDIKNIALDSHCLLDANADGSLTIKGQYNPDIDITVNIGDLLLRDRETKELCAIASGAAKMLFNNIELHITQYDYRAVKHYNGFEFIAPHDPYEAQLNPYLVDATAERVMAVRYDKHSRSVFKDAYAPGTLRLDEVCLGCGRGWLKFITHPDCIVREGDWIILREAEVNGEKWTACQMLHDDAFRAQHSRV